MFFMRWFVFSTLLCRPLLLFWCFANCQLSFLVLGWKDLDLELRWSDSHSTHLWNTKRSCWCGIAWKRERKMVKYWRSWALHSFLLPDQTFLFPSPLTPVFLLLEWVPTPPSMHCLVQFPFSPWWKEKRGPWTHLPSGATAVVWNDL